MKILVLLRSPRLSPESDEIIDGLCPSDLAALSTAMQLGQQTDSKVTAITAGLKPQEAALKAALRAGVDRAVHVIDPAISADGDLRTVCTVLAASIRMIDGDLVLTGNRSADWSTGSTGPAVAHLLKMPHITSVIEVKVHGPDELLVTHRREHCAYELVLRLPALLAVSIGPPLDTRREGDLPPVEQLSLGEVTLPFRKPLDSPKRRVTRVITKAPIALEGYQDLLSLLDRTGRAR